MRKENHLRVLCTGGGTGGHLFPAIALIQELRTRFKNPENLEILFVGTGYGLEARLLPDSDIPFESIWIRGFQRGKTFKDFRINLLFPIRLIASLLQARAIIKRFEPDIAIGTGGYTSGPPLYIASRRGIPFFIHEQNVFPGVTTKMLAGRARKVYVSFEETEKYIKNSTFIGTPLRRSLKHVAQAQAQHFFGLNSDLKTVLIFGGSQGSLAMNNTWIEAIRPFLESYRCQFIWQTGQLDYDRIEEIYPDHPCLHLTPFIHDMGVAYCAADLVVSRAGALSLAELCLYGKPSILIPLPTAARNHQEINARHLEQVGAAKVILQSDLNPSGLETAVNEILIDDQKLSRMADSARSLAKSDSAAQIINEIMEFVESDVW